MDEREQRLIDALQDWAEHEASLLAGQVHITTASGFRVLKAQGEAHEVFFEEFIGGYNSPEDAARRFVDTFTQGWELICDGPLDALVWREKPQIEETPRQLAPGKWKIYARYAIVHMAEGDVIHIEGD